MEVSESCNEFFEYLEDWLSCLRTIPLSEVAPDPQKAAVLSQDMIKGFCTIGPLASPRINEIAGNIANFLKLSWNYGIHDILLFQDAHEPDAIEFDAYPPHCVRGTEEAEVVDEITSLPFYHEMQVFEKNSISSGIQTGFNEWLTNHPNIDTFIIIGDCTDICIYQLAMHLRVSANASQIFRKIIVPANLVQTYDRPLSTAGEEGGFPHPGDLMQDIFLYHMALNAVEVVLDIE